MSNFKFDSNDISESVHFYGPIRRNTKEQRRRRRYAPYRKIQLVVKPVEKEGIEFSYEFEDNLLPQEIVDEMMNELIVSLPLENEQPTENENEDEQSTENENQFVQLEDELLDEHTRESVHHEEFTWKPADKLSVLEDLFPEISFALSASPIDLSPE